MEGVVGLVDMMGMVRLQSGQLVHLEGSEGKEWFLTNTHPTPTHRKQYCKTSMFTDE